MSELADEQLKRKAPSPETAAEVANPALLPLLQAGRGSSMKRSSPTARSRSRSATSLQRHAAFVPMIVTELFAAASTYPIVFITEPVPSVLAVLSLRDGQNLVRFGRRHEMGCDLRTGLPMRQALSLLVFLAP